MAFGKTRTELGIDLKPLGISMTGEELAAEMARWVAGESDYFDLVILEAKRLLQERFEQERPTWTDLDEPPPTKWPYHNQHQYLCRLYDLLQLTVKPDAGAMRVVDGQVVEDIVQ